MCVLRVGAVAPGETPPSNTAINREDDVPPRINKQMRRAKLILAVDLAIKLRSFDEPWMEDLSAVSDWVLMINTTPAATKMTVGTKRKCAGDDPTNEPIPRTPPMQITPSSNSTTTTSTTGDPNQFPALSSISPDALLRGKRVVNGVDLDLLLFQGMIHDSVKYCDTNNEPLQFQYSNGKHGVRLIKLPMSKYTKQISWLDCILKDAKSKLDLFTKNRRGGEESLYTSVDRIFQIIGANRAHYFGRVFEGVDIRKIMAKSDDLFGVDGEIRLKLLELSRRIQGKLTRFIKHATTSALH